MITKEEFDSQRGVEEQREDSGDTELVFPLDLQEPVVTAPSSVKPPPTEVPKQPRPQEKSVERARDTSPAKGGSSRSKRGKGERRARFYPVPVKQESPNKVCVVIFQQKSSLSN